jgi:MTH538 TIR-like domain (DUF1863)
MGYEVVPRRIFVSYYPNDRKYFQKIVRWAEQGLLGQNVLISSWDDEDLRDESGRVLFKAIEERIKESVFTIIIVGQENNDHPWLDWEGEFAHHWGIRRYVMPIPYVTGELPDELSIVKQMAYNPNSIEKLLRNNGRQDFEV